MKGRWETTGLFIYLPKFAEMTIWDVLWGLRHKWRQRRAEEVAASIIHDTDFDEQMRSVQKKLHTYADGAQALGLQPSEAARTIGQLYAAFGRRRLSSPFSYCNCCITEAKAMHLQSTQLRSLDADDLYTICANVPHTAGKIEDLLYFTPRFLEYAATEEGHFDLTQVYSNFQKAPPALDDSERGALHEYFHQVWLALRNRDPVFHSLGIYNVVLPTAVLTGEIGLYLDLWRGTPAIYRYVACIDDRDLGDAFWIPGTMAHHAVVTWLNANRDHLMGELEGVSVAFAEEGAEFLETVKERLRSAPWN